MSFFGQKRNSGLDAYNADEKKYEEDDPSIASGSLFIQSYADHDEEDLRDAARAAPGASSAKNRPTIHCCRRLLVELNPCQPWFSVTDKATERKIDIPESFAPATCLAFLWKLMAFGLTLATMVYGLVAGSNPEFYFAYTTNWALLLSVLYFGFSLYNTLAAARTVQPPDTASCRIRTTWVLFEMACTMEICISILWWVLVYERGETVLSFLSVVPHSVVAVLVFIDGNFVNRIPVRWTHWYGFVFPLLLAYLGWTVLHSYLNLGNPNESDNDPTTNDDAIYDSLAWNEDWLKALTIALITLFGIGPAIYLIMWLTSVYHIPCFCLKDRRKYVDSYKDEMSVGPSLEERSIFSRWK